MFNRDVAILHGSLAASAGLASRLNYDPELFALANEFRLALGKAPSCCPMRWINASSTQDAISQLIFSKRVVLNARPLAAVVDSIVTSRDLTIASQAIGELIRVSGRIF